MACIDDGCDFWQDYFQDCKSVPIEEIVESIECEYSDEISTLCLDKSDASWMSGAFAKALQAHTLARLDMTRSEYLDFLRAHCADILSEGGYDGCDLWWCALLRATTRESWLSMDV